jgi:hypothetical protein
VSRQAQLASIPKWDEQKSNQVEMRTGTTVTLRNPSLTKEGVIPTRALSGGISRQLPARRALLLRHGFQRGSLSFLAVIYTTSAIN